MRTRRHPRAAKTLGDGPHARSAAKDLAELRAQDVANGSDQCRECGCTENFACPEGCSWAAPHLCSACADDGRIGL